jgi:Mg2+ and Co2+ transporter CorA
MNVPIPLAERTDAFWIILFMCLISAIAFIVIWNKKITKIK